LAAAPLDIVGLYILALDIAFLGIAAMAVVVVRVVGVVLVAAVPVVIVLVSVEAVVVVGVVVRSAPIARLSHFRKVVPRVFALHLLRPDTAESVAIYPDFHLVLPVGEEGSEWLV
jgi:hypothetical protein